MAVDTLSINAAPSLADYLSAVSQYVQQAPHLTPGPAKSAQIALSSGLGRCLKAALEVRLPRLNAFAGELNVAGALRNARADVSESHELDGLRLAIEIKPINLAVGRAIWNRFGDVRAFAVNIHLKFPFAVVGGVLTVPTWEWGKAGGPAAQVPTEEGPADAPNETDAVISEVEELSAIAHSDSDSHAEPDKIATLPIIRRLVTRLQRTRRRETEADAPHLLEAVAVVVYDPDTGDLDPNVPPVGSGLRWDEFVSAIAEIYDLRFE